MIEIYTDGAFRLNKNVGKWVGGWAFVLIRGRDIIQKSGFRHNTTNNRMELIALINALETLRDNYTPPDEVRIYSDSQYMINSASLWIKGWVKRGFKGKKHRDLWETYLALSAGWNIHFIWVKGHAGDYYNELCDELASSAVDTATEII